MTTQQEIIEAIERVIARSKAYVADKAVRSEYVQNEQDCLILRQALLDAAIATEEYDVEWEEIHDELISVEHVLPVILERINKTRSKIKGHIHAGRDSLTKKDKS